MRHGILASCASILVDQEAIDQFDRGSVPQYSVPHHLLNLLDGQLLKRWSAPGNDLR
jgi:hypothetical protein